MGTKYSTLSGWQQFLDIPEAIIYLIYGSLKFLLLIVVFCNYCYTVCCKDKDWCTKDTLKCTSCKDSCVPKMKKCKLLYGIVYGIWKGFMYINIFIVNLLFGTQLGAVKRNYDEHKKEEKDQNDDLQILYIQNVRLRYMDITILAMVSLTFILAAFTTFWDRFWLDKSYICKADQAIYCFPVSSSNSNSNNFSSGLIVNCSLWNALSDEMKVTFTCFQYKYKLGEALGAVGGLITIFFITTKIGAKVMIKCAMCLFDENRYVPKEKKCRMLCCAIRRKMFCCGRSSKCCDKCEHKWTTRVIIATLLSTLEVLVSLTVGILYILDISKDDLVDKIFTSGHHEEAIAVFTNLNKLLLPLGVLSTSLLLPFEYYAKKQIEIEKNNSTTDSMSENVEVVHVDLDKLSVRDIAKQLCSSDNNKKECINLDKVPTTDDTDIV